MQRVKLIKEYPGSPPLGAIFEYWTDGISEQYTRDKVYIPKKTIDKYPDFWAVMSEEKLFTTKDGVNIYHPSTYFALHNNGVINKVETSNNINYDYHEDRYGPTEFYNKTGTHYFSTLEAAKKYYNFNIRCLSINDVIEARQRGTSIESYLIKLVNLRRNIIT